MYFTDRERAAIVKLIKLVTCADGEIKPVEILISKGEMERIGVTNVDAVLKAADDMDFGTACSVVSQMTASEKKYVCAMTGALIAADLEITKSEEAIWSLLYKLCDFPVMNFKEAIDYMANL